MAITSQELADLCGVSRGTVVRALSNKGRIDPNTKARIIAKADELGYRPNPIARSLVSGKSKSIGVIAFDIRNRYFAQLLNAIEIEAKKQGYFISFTLQENDPELEKKMVRELAARRVDGILLCPVNKGKKYSSMLESLGIPVLTIGNFISTQIPYIGMDDRQAASDAMDLIISKGYTDIIFYCPPLLERKDKNVYVHEKRLEGVLSAGSRNTDVGLAIYEKRDISKLLISKVKSESSKTACFCSGDIFALEILKTLRLSNISVPKQIGLVGFDGIDTIEYVTPTLTTIYNPVEKIGKDSIHMMIRKIENDIPLPSLTLIPYKVRPGETL